MEGNSNEIYKIKHPLQRKLKEHDKNIYLWSNVLCKPNSNNRVTSI